MSHLRFCKTSRLRQESLDSRRREMNLFATHKRDPRLPGRRSVLGALALQLVPYLVVKVGGELVDGEVAP